MLKVLHSFYPSINIVANVNYNADIEPNFDSMEVRANISSTNNEETTFQIMLAVTLEDDDSQSIPYRFSISGVAAFECTFDSKEERVLKAAFNGAGIVYAGIREQLATLSSRSAFGVVTLPTYHFSSKDFHESETEK